MPKGYSIDRSVPCIGSASVAVLIVGYDHDSYILKGSWGKDFGDNGYFRIKIGGGGAGICSVNSRNFFPILV